MLTIALTVFIPLTGGLIWLSYQHPKAFNKIVSGPWTAVLLLGAAAVVFCLGMMAMAHRDISEEIQSNPEILSGRLTFLVPQLLMIIKYLWFSILGVLAFVLYMRSIMFIGKTINESRQETTIDDSGAEKTPED